MTGRSSGNCTSQKMCHFDAPSISAASIGSFGMAERPASRMMNEKGVQFQISSSATVASAMSGFVSQAGLKSTPMIFEMIALIGPLWYSIISAV